METAKFEQHDGMKRKWIKHTSRLNKLTFEEVDDGLSNDEKLSAIFLHVPIHLIHSDVPVAVSAHEKSTQNQTHFLYGP